MLRGDASPLRRRLSEHRAQRDAELRHDQVEIQHVVPREREWSSVRLMNGRSRIAARNCAQPQLALLLRSTNAASAGNTSSWFWHAATVDLNTSVVRKLVDQNPSDIHSWHGVPSETRSATAPGSTRRCGVSRRASERGQRVR